MSKQTIWIYRTGGCFTTGSVIGYSINIMVNYEM